MTNWRQISPAPIYDFPPAHPPLNFQFFWRDPDHDAYQISFMTLRFAALDLIEDLREVRLCFDRLDLSNLRMQETGAPPRAERDSIVQRSPPRRGAPVLPCIFRGDSDANKVQGFSVGRRRSGGGHVERGDGEISLCAGLQVLSPRLPADPVAGVFKPGIRRGIRGGGRGREGGC
jgi:hypothetical protein